MALAEAIRALISLPQNSVTARVQRFGQCSFHFTGAYAQRLVQFTTTLALAVIGQTGTGRDQTTHNHVFFQAAQVIALAGNGRFGQYAGGLLERGRRDERFGRQRRLGDTLASFSAMASPTPLSAVTDT